MTIVNTADSVTLRGVPESITEQQFLGLFEALNIDPKAVMSLEVHWNGIAATLAARDANNRMIMDAKSNDVHTHTIFIRVAGRDGVA